MATDDSAVFLASQDWLDEAELAQTPLKGVELILANASRVGWIRTKEIDRDLLDGEEAGAGHADLTREAATHSSRPSIGMRQAVNARPNPSGRASSVSDRTRDRLPPRTARRHPSPVLYFATQYVTMAMPNVAVRTSVYPGSVTCGPVACTAQR